MTGQPQFVRYKDELLPDKSVRRSYEDGRYEWRWRLPDSRVEWQDNTGAAGIDEMVGDTIVKRTFNDGRILYGREQGYGRTAWSGGTSLVTVNASSFGGRVGAILAGVGAGALMGSIMWPPDMMSAAEEEALREEARRAGDGGGGGGDGGGGDGGDWGDGDGGDASDFG